MTRQYSVLVAEDEPALRRHVCQKIAQLGEQYLLVGAVEDGKAALQLAKDQQPDIILTDIRMPGLSGLELLQKVQEERLDAEAILMSGYDDFTYAKEAVRLGVNEYLLKPISQSDLKQALEKAAAEVDRRRLQRRAELLMSLHTPQAVHTEQAAKSHVFLLCYGNLRTSENVQVSPMLTDQQVLSLLSIRSEQLWLLPEQHKNEQLMILQDHIHSVAETAEILVRGRFDLHIIALENAVSRDELYTAAEKLRQAKQALVTPWRSEIIIADRLQSSKRGAQGKPSRSAREREQLLACLLAGKADSFQKTLYDLLRSRWEQKLSQKLFERFVLRVSDVCFEICSTKIDQSERNAAVGACIASVRTSDCFEQFAKTMYLCLQPLLFADNMQESRESVVLRVQKYMQERYMDAPNLSVLAEMAGMTPAAFTRAFQNRFGETPMKYLINLRIDVASRLLIDHPLLSVHKIGEMVGYPDQFHFSRTFKKVTGLSPSEFRDAKNANSTQPGK